MDYYRVLGDDAKFPDRWFLDEPRTGEGHEIDAREFTYGEPYRGTRPEIVPIQQTGRAVGFNLAAFDMPVVLESIGLILENIPCMDVQRFPVTIGDGIKGYDILNVACTEECVDEGLSEIMKWKPEDGRPDKVGQYRMVVNLTIDPLRTNNRHIFRIRGWEVALIVSGTVKQAIEAIDNLGIVFKSVMPGRKGDQEGRKIGHIESAGIKTGIE